MRFNLAGKPARHIPLIIALALSACAVQTAQPSGVNSGAERLLAVVASATPQMATPATAPTNVPPAVSQGTLAPSPTPDLPPIYARCITRAELTMHVEPDERAPVLTDLRLREVFTVYGRTLNTQWVVGWTAAKVYGWVRTRNIGCSVPIVELKPMPPQLLVEATPTPEAIAQAPIPVSPTTLPTPTQAQILAADTPAATPTSIALVSTPAPPTATPAPTQRVAAAQPDATPTSPSQAAQGAVTPVPLPVVLGATIPPITVEIPVGPTPLVLVFAVTVVNPEVLLTPTPSPASPLQPTPTGTLAELQCRVSAASAVNIRRRPARDAERVGVLFASGEWLARARNTDTSWVFGTSREGIEGWVIASVLSCQGAVESLPVRMP
ncbi:MAG: hypothetical protein RMM31_07025 [Anaerolineae bacterium]|nr:hypothetical protein [Anaerolineae bacterium]